MQWCGVVLNLGPTPWTFMPGGRPYAPGRLRLVEALVNTINLDTGEDAIASPDGLAAWLAAFSDVNIALGLVASHTSDVARAADLREALRMLLRRNTGDDVDCRDAAAIIRQVSAAAHLTIRIDDPPRLVGDAAGVDGALGTVTAAAYDAIIAGVWPRLKACSRCHWAFYDTSRNHSSIWCSMQYCGNRTKTRRYRHRQANG